jgi:sucrose-6-phosphate hydrolase SacC (GH32 family)
VGASVPIPAAGIALPPGADIEIDLPASAGGDAGLRFGNANGEEALVGLTSSPPEVFIDRRNARKGAWHKEYPGRHAAPVRIVDGRISLRVLFDRSVIEVFVNGGEQVLTDRVYPTAPYDRVAWIGGVPPPASRSRLWTIAPSMGPGKPNRR